MYTLFANPRRFHVNLLSRASRQGDRALQHLPCPTKLGAEEGSDLGCQIMYLLYLNYFLSQCSASNSVLPSRAHPPAGACGRMPPQLRSKDVLVSRFKLYMMADASVHGGHAFSLLFYLTGSATTDLFLKVYDSY